jgi:hypothetical protein
VCLHLDLAANTFCLRHRVAEQKRNDMQIQIRVVLVKKRGIFSRLVDFRINQMRQSNNPPDMIEVVRPVILAHVFLHESRNFGYQGRIVLRSLPSCASSEDGFGSGRPASAAN